jgi:hypothetical protein
VTAFPADAESNLFKGPYPEFFQALAHFAYPGDVRRIREAHSGWSEPREYSPLYDVQFGFDAPKTGKAFKILWLKCEDGSVRAWRRRRAQDWTMLDPYERIDSNEFRTRREEAERRMRLPPRQRIPMVEGYQLVGERPLGEGVDPQIPERDSFLILGANEAFLTVVVVSRDDVLKRASTALAGAVPSVTELGRRGGKRSGEVRRKSRRWVPHAEEIALTIDPNLSNEDIANAITDRWKRADVNYPGDRTLVRFVAQLRAAGTLPPREPRPKASKPK